MLRRWWKSLFPPPPLPSAYIQSFLDGSISSDEFDSNVGDGWVGSDSDDWSWLNRFYDVVRRFDPDFPGSALDVWDNEEARNELRQLVAELRRVGR